MIGLTKVVGKEYAETGITCNAVAPAGSCLDLLAEGGAGGWLTRAIFLPKKKKKNRNKIARFLLWLGQ